MAQKVRDEKISSCKRFWLQHNEIMVDENTKMLRILMNGQSKIHEELKRIREEAKEIEKRLASKIDAVDIKLTKRVDRLGLDLAKLSDDAPTIEEFDELKVRVDKLQRQFAFS